jgi:hypothetical protein
MMGRGNKYIEEVDRFVEDDLAVLFGEEVFASLPGDWPVH